MGQRRREGFNRRQWLQRTAAGTVGAAVAPAWLGAATPSEPARLAEPPRHVVVMVADGMSVGVPTLAQAFSQRVRGTGTEWWALARRPDVTCGWMDMGSLTSLVTDSAAAASSWGSGSRVRNGSINVLPDGTRLTPLVDVARDAGRRIGLVTTTTITHATPAGFAAATANRNAEEDVAAQYLDRIDVLLGGGARFFDAGRRADGRDLLADYERAGYALFRNRTALHAGPRRGRTLGLFAPEHLPYSLDRAADAVVEHQVPTLAEMAEYALAALADSPRGFFLVVEGGRVDHAAHANDAAAILWDQLAFDDAVARVRAVADRRGDTLVLVMSDHGNANPGLNGMGGSYLDSTTHFERVLQARASFGVVKARLAGTSGGARRRASAASRDLLEELLGLRVSPAEATAVAEAASRAVPTVLNRQLAAFDGVLGQVTANHWGIGWTGTTHTADLAPVLAFGPGREAFHGLRTNTDIFGLLLDTMGLHFRNPRMSPEAAAPLVGTLGAASREWVPA